MRALVIARVKSTISSFEVEKLPVKQSELSSGLAEFSSKIMPSLIKMGLDDDFIGFGIQKTYPHVVKKPQFFYQSGKIPPKNLQLFSHYTTELIPGTFEPVARDCPNDCLTFGAAALPVFKKCLLDHGLFSKNLNVSNEPVYRRKVGKYRPFHFSKFGRELNSHRLTMLISDNIVGTLHLMHRHHGGQNCEKPGKKSLPFVKPSFFSLYFNSNRHPKDGQKSYGATDQKGDKKLFHDYAPRLVFYNRLRSHNLFTSRGVLQ